MGELVFNLVLIVVFSIMAINGTHIEIFKNQNMSVYWPEAILIALIALLIISTINILIKLKKEGKLQFDFKTLVNGNTLKTLLGFSLLGVYAFIMEYIGFVLSSVIIGCCFARIFGQKNLFKNILYNIIIVLVIYSVFCWGLNIILPRGMGIFRKFSLMLESLV